MKRVMRFNEFLNEGLSSRETKSLAELIGKGLDPETFYEYLRDYSADEPDGEYGYSESDLDLIIKAFDEIKQEASGMTRLNISQVKNSKLYKSYINESLNENLNENQFFIDKNNPEEKIVVSVKKGGYVVFYQSHPFSNETREFIVDVKQIPELIKILSKIK